MKSACGGAQAHTYNDEMKLQLRDERVHLNYLDAFDMDADPEMLNVARGCFNISQDTAAFSLTSSSAASSFSSAVFSSGFCLSCTAMLRLGK